PDSCPLTPWRTRPMSTRMLFSASLVTFLLLAHAAAADDHPEIPLWPNGAPGSEEHKDEKEVKTDKPNNEYTITNEHNPSITVYLPPNDKATGAAVVIAPGGGHSAIWIVHEGLNEAKCLADHGVAAFVLKYRLARERNSPYKLPDTPTADGQRAIRLVRSRAAE